MMQFAHVSPEDALEKLRPAAEVRAKDLPAYIKLVRDTLSVTSDNETPEWADQKLRDFYAEYRLHQHRGEEWAEMILLYGPSVLSLPPDVYTSLRVAKQYAYAVKRRIAHEESGAGVPPVAFFRTYGMDQAEATRHRNEWRAAQAIARAR